MAGKTTGTPAPASRLSACGTLLTAFAETGPDLDVHGREAHGLVVAFEPERHTVHACTREYVLHGEPSLDFRLAGFVRRAVRRILRLGAVAPRPDDGGAVVLLVIVGAAQQLRRQHDARGRDRDHRLRLQREFRAL